MVSVLKAPEFAFNWVVEVWPLTSKFVVVTLVSVALTPVKFWSEVEPRTVKVDVTVELAPTNPP